MTITLVCGVILSLCPSEKNTQMDGTIIISENFSVNKLAYRKYTNIEIVLSGFLILFSDFTFCSHGFHLIKLKIIPHDF